MTKPQSLCLFFLLLLATNTFAVSKDKEEKQKVYNIRYGKDIALSTVQFGGIYLRKPTWQGPFAQTP